MREGGKYPVPPYEREREWRQQLPHTYRIPRSEGRTMGGKGLRWNLESRINPLSEMPLSRFVGCIQALAMDSYSSRHVKPPD
jgi:hypothetical protein